MTPLLRFSLIYLNSVLQNILIYRYDTFLCPNSPKVFHIFEANINDI